MQREHADRPAFHLAPQQGWLNDPNGPLYYNGKYHMFYQHLVQGCEWGFGIVWGHAVSTDLVHWERLPEALVPTPGGVDADGCFSGCATVDNDGRPIILFTGVRLRSNPNCGPLPPPDRDLQLPFIESQCYAVADPGCDNLSMWHKAEMPFISLPPPGVADQLAGWRDPYIIHRGDGAEQPWVMLLGSGIKGKGGTALMYASWDLLSGWQYVGMLACGDGETGLVWECPILALLPTLPPQRLHAAEALQQPPQCEAGCNCQTHPAGPAHGKSAPSLRNDPRQPAASPAPPAHDAAPAGPGVVVREGEATAAGEQQEADEAGPLPPHSWFFCISPDAPTNPTLYWLGDYDGREFFVGAARGPLRLDLGDVLYAPNTLEDPHGRLLLWGWLQERRKVGTYDYAGCLSVPRMLHRHNGRLHQSPVPEVANLRTDVSWIAQGVEVMEAAPVPLGVAGCHLDIEVVLQRGDATASGLLLRCFDTSVGEGDAYLLYHWERRHLEVVVEGLHPDTLQYTADAPTARRMGGAVDSGEGGLGAEGGAREVEEEVALRVLLDHSVLEVFVGTGEALSTRVYLGAPPQDCQQAAVEFVSQGGSTTLARVAAYEVASIWRPPPAQEQQQPQQQQVEEVLAQLQGAAMLQQVPEGAQEPAQPVPVPAAAAAAATAAAAAIPQLAPAPALSPVAVPAYEDAGVPFPWPPQQQQPPQPPQPQQQQLQLQRELTLGDSLPPVEDMPLVQSWQHQPPLEQLNLLSLTT